MRYLYASLLLLMLTISSNAQFYLEPRFLLGTNTPTGEEFAEVFGTGFNTSLFIPILGIDSSVVLGGNINVNYHHKYFDQITGNDMWNYSFGLKAEYHHSLKPKGLDLIAGIMSSYEYLSDRVFPRDGIARERNFIKGDGFSTSFTLGLRYYRFTFEAFYHLRPITVEFSDEVRGQLTPHDELYQLFFINDNKMDFSSLNFSIGFLLP